MSSHLLFNRVGRSASQTARVFSSAGKVTPPLKGEAGSIYSSSDGSDLFRQVMFDTEGTELDAHVHPEFRRQVNLLFQQHKPSAHSFFKTLREAPAAVVKNEGFLNEFYFRYQAAMHCTRVAVWFAPYTNTPELRQRKLSIISDDDSIDKRSHHMQLEDMFRSFGAKPLSADHFSDLAPLAARADPATKNFISVVDDLYRKSTGAWCIAEVLSDDWLSALATSFEPQFPHVMKAEYFDEVFSGHVEVRHMLETVAITEVILHRHPELEKEVIGHMHAMVKNLDSLWTNLESLVKNPTAYLTKK